MPYAIVASSPKAAEIAKTQKPQSTQTIYPFDALEIGQSFTVPKAEANYKSLHAVASRKGKLQAKKFAVIQHDEPPVIEVARIA